MKENILKRFLETISLGKVNAGLSMNGKRSQSSIYGGILTIIAAIGILIYTSIVFNQITQRMHYNLDETTRPFIGLKINETLYTTNETN